MTQSVCILGVTGSIGQSTLKILNQHPDKYSVFAISAHSRISELVDICKQFQPKVAVVPKQKVDELAALFVKSELQNIEILADQEGLLSIASHPDVDVVMAAIVGAAGLLPTLAAVKAGKRVLLANKEALVMSGEIMMQAARDHQALLLPVDSEHNAIFQSLPHNYLEAERNGQPQQGVSRILLTASGGPFLNHSLEQLEKVTPAQACMHPNWSMGQKISVDSATLMNKGLELIEACHLFSISEHFVTVVVHPQSIIHSLVQFEDGSMKAQLGLPDMKLPIQYAMTFPNRLKTDFPRFNFMDYPKFTFEKADPKTFRNLGLAFDAMHQGGNMPCVLNAANEVAVAKFLKEEIGFLEMSDSIEKAMTSIQFIKNPSLEDYFETDKLTREFFA